MNLGISLALAMVLDALLGEPDWLWKRLPHPAVLAGRLIGWADGRFNAGRHRKWRGAMLVLALVVVGGVIGTALSALGPLVEVIGAAILLAQKSLVTHVRTVADGLRMSLPQGRRAVSMIVSRDTTDMPAEGVARSAIESAAENLSDGVVAPAFWFLVAGLPGILIYKLINTADSMIGYRTPRYVDFGWAAARLDDLLNLVPARLTALIIALLSGRMGDWRDIRADAVRHRSPNAGWPEAAMARVLGVALAGPRAYDGVMQPFPWVHPAGRKEIGPADIDAAIGQLWRVWAAMIFLSVILALTLM